MDVLGTPADLNECMHTETRSCRELRLIRIQHHGQLHSEQESAVSSGVIKRAGTFHLSWGLGIQTQMFPLSYRKNSLIKPAPSTVLVRSDWSGGRRSLWGDRDGMRGEGLLVWTEPVPDFP